MVIKKALHGEFKTSHAAFYIFLLGRELQKIQDKLSDYLNFSGFSTRMDKILPHSVQISAIIADPDLNIPPLTGVIFA